MNLHPAPGRRRQAQHRVVVQLETHRPSGTRWHGLELDLDVSSAKIHTMGGDVVDTFYVTDSTGQKIVDGEYQGEIRRALMHVLDPAD